MESVVAALVKAGLVKSGAPLRLAIEEPRIDGFAPVTERMRQAPRDALQRAENGTPEIPPENLEVCLLERTRSGRKFRRLSADELRGMLGL